MKNSVLGPFGLIPQPHHVEERPGSFRIPVEGVLFISDSKFLHAAEICRAALGSFAIRKDPEEHRHTVSICRSARKRPGYYSLTISPQSITITAADPGAAENAARTVKQLVLQNDQHRLPCLHISDWPDFPLRGIYYDVTRGRVPRMQHLKRQIDYLASMKMNHFQLYFEHSCFFPSYPFLSDDASPLTARDILDLDDYCKSRSVELVPSLATFGHMARLLDNPKLSHLAEDFGKGKYTHPDAHLLPESHRRRASTISPANPGTYKFLAAIFDDFLPLFSSRYFNICCDEVFDLGYGQTYSLCRRKGTDEVFLQHIKKLHSLAKAHKRKVMVWGDMVYRHNLARKLPSDIIILDWGYTAGHDFKSLKSFSRLKRSVAGCPGTSSWVALFPRIHEAAVNIDRYARQAKMLKADGLITTDWGDRGHSNLMEYSWLCYAIAAEKAWNASSDLSSIIKRFARICLGSSSKKLADAIILLGDISHLSVDGYYQGAWWHILDQPHSSSLFDGKIKSGWTARGGSVTRARFHLNRRLASKAITDLQRVRAALTSAARQQKADIYGIIPYWLFAVDMTIHSAGRLAFLCASPRDYDKTEAASLAADINGLQKRFKKLWLASNRKSEIQTAIQLFKKLEREYRTLQAR